MSSPIEPNATTIPTARRGFLAALALGGLGGSLATWLAGRSSGPGQMAPSAPALSLSMADHEEYMRLAIAQANKVPQRPFGAVIVDPVDRRVLAEGFAHVADSPTFHGEIDAINRCAAHHPKVEWRRLVLYTTGEPCPMCQTAALWCGVAGVVYGSATPVLQECGWGTVDMRAADVVRHAFTPCALLGGVLEQECNAIFRAGVRGPLRKD